MLSTHSYAIPTLNHQRGMATLVVALVLLIAVTIMTFNVARVSALEQRIAANDVRTLTAHEAAQAGIEQAIAYLNANLPQIDSIATNGWNNAMGWDNPISTPRWTPCSTSDIALPCGDGESNKYDNTWLRYTPPNQISLPGSPYTTIVYYLTLNAASVSGNVGGRVGDQPRIIIIASATPNADALAGSAVIQQITQYFSLAHTSSSPLAALGQVNLSGNIFVYGDPNPPPSFYPPLTAGKPLSVWASGAVSVGGSAQTCRPGTNCSGTDKLSYSKQDGGDLAQYDPKFPTDTFQYVFGVPNSEAATIKAKFTFQSNCDGFSSASSGLYWVTGTCSVGTAVASATAPAIIVVEGDFSMNSSDQFYGLVYARGTATAKLTGTPTLWGGLVSDHDINLGVGNYTSRYLDLSKFHGNNTGGFAKVPGGWLDAYNRPVP